MSLIAIVEQALNGLILSVIYALTALGLSLIFGVLRIVNFAHGEVYMIGGYAYYCAVTLLGVPPVLGVATAGVALLAFGAALERGLLGPIHSGRVDRPDEYAIMTTFALSILLINLANAVFGPWPQRPEPIFRGRVEVGELIVSGDRLAAAGAGVVLIAATLAALRFTWAGKAVRAIAQDRGAAETFGVDVARASMLAFGTGAALAGAAGALGGARLQRHAGDGRGPGDQGLHHHRPRRLGLDPGRARGRGDPRRGRELRHRAHPRHDPRAGPTKTPTGSRCWCWCCSCGRRASSAGRADAREPAEPGARRRGVGRLSRPAADGPARVLGLHRPPSASTTRCSPAAGRCSWALSGASASRRRR